MESVFIACSLFLLFMKGVIYLDNYFNRYLTDQCAKCADWRDGSNGKENGCFAEVSMNCPYLAEKIKAEKEAISEET